MLSSCEDFKTVSDSETEDSAKTGSDSESEQRGGRYRARYRQLAHFGILFVSSYFLFKLCLNDGVAM